jgi:hypothetical protein
MDCRLLRPLNARRIAVTMMPESANQSGDVPETAWLISAFV